MKFPVPHDVKAKQIPGTEGDMGIFPGHAPVLSTLRPGVVTVYKEGGGTDRIFVATDSSAEVAVFDRYQEDDANSGEIANRSREERVSPRPVMPSNRRTR